MNGLASASTDPQSLLHTSTNSLAGAAHPIGAGSTTILDSHSSLQDSHSSVDQDPAATAVANIAPDDLSHSASLHPATESPQTEGEFVQTTEVIGVAQDKGGHSETENVEADTSIIKEDGEVLLRHVNGQIDLVEHTPTHDPGLGDGGLIMTDEGGDWLPESDHELKRVKVYQLTGSRWIDQGTAFCYGQISEETSDALLVARSERNPNQVILSTAIRSNDVYQRQQDTLIVWTEPDGVDYALSFQDPEGCAETWAFIQEVQRHMNMSDDPTVVSSPLLGETSVTTSSIIRSGHLPPPQLGIISEIERAIKALARTQTVKERICDYIQRENYIKALIKVMHTAEDLENLENLHALCSLMQSILMLNDHTMYEHILEDDIFFGVVGMLEYDPDFPQHKANYRDFLHNTAQFHQPIPMRDVSIQKKIHHTYRLQFLKDVVLARALDDSTFNVLNSCIIFNQIDIIQHIQQEPQFLHDVVRLFVNEDMLIGGSSTARRATLQTQQQQQQLQAPASSNQLTHEQHPHADTSTSSSSQTLTSTPTSQSQPLVISLNTNGDNVKTDASQMDVDQKPAASSPKAVNGTSAHTNGRGRRSNSYAFAPPDDLSEDDIALRREVVLLLQQLAIMGKNVQMPARIGLFRTLVDRGVLFAVQWAMELPENVDANKQMISAGGEVLSALLDHDINGVRAHVLKQTVAIEKERESGKKGADKAETFLHVLCRIMAKSKDLAVQSQVGDALKVWLDTPTIDSTAGSGSEVGPKLPTMVRKDEPGTERFIEYFYKHCISTLLKPLLDLSEWKNFTEPSLSLTRDATNRFVYLCDLVHNFLQQHNFRSHFYIMSTDILARIATLFKAKDKHLRHSAFRIFRLLLKQGNPNSHTQIMKHDILKPILDLTLKESRRDNLLSCSCQEYFEHMRRENMKDLIKFCMVHHESEIEKLSKTPLGAQRFELFIRRHEMNIAPPPEVSSPPDKSGLDRGWSGPGHVPDTAEEDYFNADDDEDDEYISTTSGFVPTSYQQRQWASSAGGNASSVVSPLSTNNTGMKRKRRPGLTSAPKGYRPPPLKAPQLSALLDYEDDDNEDEESGSSDATEILPATSGPTASDLGSTSPSSENFTTTSRRPTDQPVSPVIESSGPPPMRYNKEDEEDNLLEALARTQRARSQSPSPTLAPLRPSEKRRREDDDDDDELLTRLTKAPKAESNKKQTPQIALGKSKAGDDPPSKKIKVKFGSVGLAVASTTTALAVSLSKEDAELPSPPADTPPSSELGKKDEDTG
ncbi:hypothetical protein JR316_0004447 [Psilocybe cubensis]|uniref:Uncharacterized protein n=2 Tax=Psilocybe cubensis TaxID=181762 RepID=A0ACB8H3C2_PSICU|nr:hypothetical protein JR316_0004447 [Psilocybe cubensis]KAH9482349.1 hypothetical protein JR316_0004447 [Psilocybe cubensis]